jgi:protein-disulfide isomerase
MNPPASSGVHDAGAVDEREHVLGPADAPVTLLQYGNYECLHCRRAYPYTEALRGEFGPRLRFVFRHFARTADFPMAQRAAEAAEAAHVQGRFWEMHHLLLTGTPLLTPHSFVDYAEVLGLDIEWFDDDMANRRHLARVQDDLASGIASGVRGTPAFFVDGLLHADSWDLDGLRHVVTRALDGGGLPLAAARPLHLDR